MPIDTSVITGTQAHKHEMDSSTGGFLESGLTGMTNLTEGGIIQGSAANIQTNLPIGNPTEILVVNAGGTALEYQAAAAGGASCTDMMTLSNGDSYQLCTLLEFGACS